MHSTDRRNYDSLTTSRPTGLPATRCRPVATPTVPPVRFHVTARRPSATNRTTADA